MHMFRSNSPARAKMALGFASIAALMVDVQAATTAHRHALGIDDRAVNNAVSAVHSHHAGAPMSAAQCVTDVSAATKNADNKPNIGSDLNSITAFVGNSSASCGARGNYTGNLAA